MKCESAAAFAMPAVVPQLLTSPSSSGWALWRAMECRTAGFPAALVVGAADSGCARAADELAVADALHSRLWSKSRVELKNRIRALLQEQRSQARDFDKHLEYEGVIRNLRRAIKAADSHRLNNDLREVLAPTAIDELSCAMRRKADATATFLAQYEDAEQSISRHLQEVVAMPPFREAVTWQNKRVVSDVLDRLADGSRGKRKRGEELVGSYLQRYCVKNDTIGFFGPVGWASWDDGIRTLRVQIGSRPLASRRVYFEDWAIQALADRLSADSRFLPWAVPTPAPYARLDGRVLRLSGGSHETISAEAAAVFRACDGQVTARQIADRLLANPFLPFDEASQVFDALRSLSHSRRIWWGFQVRLSDPLPERHLRAQVEGIDDPDLRREALQPLEQLEAARAEVARAAGQPDKLASALQRLDEVFETVVGAPATRSPGETYGARTVVYEDCQRAASVALGPELMDRLIPPLDIVLGSARWFCHSIADVFLDALQGAYDRCGGARIHLPDFWLQVQSLFYGTGPNAASEVRLELQRRWGELLAAGVGQDEVVLRSENLAHRAQELFNTTRSGWTGGCYQSPDVMIAASDIAAIARGEYQFVLGEVHAGTNTLINHSAVQQHSDPTALLEQLHADLGEPRVMPLISRSGTRQPIRVQTVVDPRHDIEVQFSLDAVPLNPQRALRLFDLYVERDTTAGLVVRSYDGAHSFLLLDVFGQLLSGFVADKFRICSDEGKSTPRIKIDNLVIQRRQWRTPCESLVPTENSDSDANGYLAFRTWATSVGLPRFSFVNFRWERKPLYLDLDSPLYVRAILRQMRKASKRLEDRGSTVAFSEMLPAHDQLWMPLDRVARCTSELRLVAVNLHDLRKAP